MGGYTAEKKGLPSTPNPYSPTNRLTQRLTPQAEPGRQPSKRGVGLSFGPDVTEKFLERNNLKMVVRSHEVGALAGASRNRWGGGCVCVCGWGDGLDRMNGRTRWVCVSFVCSPYPPPC